MCARRDGQPRSLARFDGDLEAAAAWCEQSVQLGTGVRNLTAVLHVRSTLADIDLLEAITLLSATGAAREKASMPEPPASDRLLGALRTDTDAGRFTEVHPATARHAPLVGTVDPFAAALGVLDSRR